MDPRSEFRASVARGERPNIVVRLALPDALTAAPAGRVAGGVFSDGEVDLYGDTIGPGWEWPGNVSALYGHDISSVANVIGRVQNLAVRGSQLIGDIRFAEAEVNPVADTVFRMIQQGYLSGVSVGFAPLEWELTKDKSRPGGIDFKRQRLLEVSVTPVPANGNAMIQAKAAGINVDRLRSFSPASSVDDAHTLAAWRRRVRDDRVSLFNRGRL